MAVRTTKRHSSSEIPQGLVCVGSAVAFDCKNQEPHAASGRIRWAKNNSVKIDPAQLWDTCFRCRRPMGCPGCVSHPICTRCLVVTDMEYFIEHGPLSNDRVNVNHRGERFAPPIRVYPAEWRTAYMKAHPDTATVEDQELYDRFSRESRRLIEKSRMPRNPTKRDLERNRNSQVAELTQWAR